MNDILSKYIEIAVEVMLFALLLTIVSLFSGLAKDSLILHNDQIKIREDIGHYRELSTYINKGKLVGGVLVDNVITGDDVIRFVGTFRHEVEIDIDTGSQIINLKKYINNPDGTSNWDVEYVVGKLQNHRISTFKIESEIDEFSDEVTKVKFIKQ